MGPLHLGFRYVTIFRKDFTFYLVESLWCALEYEVNIMGCRAAEGL